MTTSFQILVRHLIVKVFGLLTAVKVRGHLVAHVAGHERRLQSSEGFLHLREALQEEEATTSEEHSDSRWDLKAQQVLLTLREPRTLSF